MAVTKPDGEVLECDGLYVMDAAAFPTAVGVNPSATIAAVAEYKIERFIENVLVQDQAPSERESWIAAWHEERQPNNDNVEQWIDALKDAYGDEHVLNPLAPIGTKETGKPASQSLGLTFDETMSGLFVEPPKDEAESVVDWDKLTGFDVGKSHFDQAERKGMEQNNLLTLKLKATIDDLDRFFRTQCRGLATKNRLVRAYLSRRRHRLRGRCEQKLYSDVLPAAVFRPSGSGCQEAQTSVLFPILHCFQGSKKSVLDRRCQSAGRWSTL